MEFNGIPFKRLDHNLKLLIVIGMIDAETVEAQMNQSISIASAFNAENRTTGTMIYESKKIGYIGMPVVGSTCARTFNIGFKCDFYGSIADVRINRLPALKWLNSPIEKKRGKRSRKSWQPEKYHNGIKKHR